MLQCQGSFRVIIYIIYLLHPFFFGGLKYTSFQESVEFSGSKKLVFKRKYGQSCRLKVTLRALSFGALRSLTTPQKLSGKGRSIDRQRTMLTMKAGWSLQGLQRTIKHVATRSNWAWNTLHHVATKINQSCWLVLPPSQWRRHRIPLDRDYSNF